MLEPWRVVETRVLYEDRWLKVRSDRCVDRLGRTIEPYHVLEFPEWVNVVALSKKGEIVLAREYRHGIGAIVTGLPSGGMERLDADLQGVSRRELAEETGYVGGEFEVLMAHPANPANQDNRVWNVLIIGVEPTGVRDLDPTEDIEVVVEDYAAFMGRYWRGGLAIQVSHGAALGQAAIRLMKGPVPPWAEGLRAVLRAEFHRFLEEG